MLKIEISPAVFQAVHPQLSIVVILARHLDNSTKLIPSQHLLGEVENVTRMTFNKETMKNHHLIAPWAVVQEEFGKEARHYRTSVEHLLQDVLRHKNLSTKTTLLNLVRYLSLKYIVPAAVDDAATIEGNLLFTVATGKAKASLFHRVKKGELYYRDEKKILGAKLDYWKNATTAPTPTTKDALIHLEILPPITKEVRDRIVGEFVSLIETFCGGTAKIVILNQKKMKAVLR